jgi:hypothetical protein
VAELGAGGKEKGSTEGSSISGNWEKRRKQGRETEAKIPTGKEESEQESQETETEKHYQSHEAGTG